MGFTRWSFSPHLHWLGYQTGEQTLQTRNLEIQDVASSFHWLWRLGASFLICQNITDTLGRHVPQIMHESATGCAVSDHSSDMYWRSLYTDYSTHDSLGGRYAAQGELKETGARQGGSPPFRLQARKRQIKGPHQAAWLQSLPSGPVWAALAEGRTPRRLSRQQFWLAAAHPPFDCQGLLCSTCSRVPPQAYLISQLVHSSQQRMRSLCLFTYWNIIALQSCVNICCTMEWISYMYPYVPSLLSLPPIILVILPICVITEHWVELPVLYGMFPLATYFPQIVYMLLLLFSRPVVSDSLQPHAL